MADTNVDHDLDAFTARVLTPQGMWRKVRVLIADGAASVVAPGDGGHPVVVLTRPVEGVTAKGAGWVVDVTGDAGEEHWVVDPPCGCGSPSKRWGTAELVAAAARARATEAG
jgi:hypothetical protein